MKHRILWALVVLNVLLAVGLVMRLTHDNSASAQVRRPAEYLLIPGDISGGASSVVYMVDTTNGWLGAMAFDDSRNVLNTMPPIDLSRVFDSGPTGAGPVNNLPPVVGPNGRTPNGNPPVPGNRNGVNR